MGGGSGRIHGAGKELLGQAGRTVPQTDTGGRDEQSKAHERTRAKELGKMRT